MDLSISPVVFNSLRTLNVEKLSKASPKDIRPVLPCLVRTCLISPIDSTKKCSEDRKKILTILSGIETVNSIVALLSIDFHALETDVKREQQLRQKVGSAQSDSILAQSLQNGLAMEFERSDPTRRLRLVLSDLLFILSQVQEEQSQFQQQSQQQQSNQQQRNNQENFIKHSDLFENWVFVPEICDVLNIAIAELPALLSPMDIVETLLHVKHGPDIICWIVANLPDCFWEVCKALVANADKQDDDTVGGKIRMLALTALCQMCPSMSLSVRSKCVELCKMPGLAVTLTLDHAKSTNGSVNDIVSFVSGLLLGSDQHIRNWFSSFLRTRQKRSRESSSFQQLRDELQNHLSGIVNLSQNNILPDSHVVQASSLLRLYCALRGIAGIKLQDEEIGLLVSLVTSKPPATAAGVRFVSLGLCMLIACPSLIVNYEGKCIEWVQWLVKEEAYLESGSCIRSSFGEMLLLMAIHFHSNQLSAICDLVCSTLGMKVPIRHNNMTRMKNVFTQDIFTEQVVTAHAVKVPVTINLNANITGFLPVHCIHQLLKSRAFTKYKVPIKDWIYRQFCCSIPPLHPVLPALVEVYVNSILMPAGKQENTNQPISEDEIRAVFSDAIPQPGKSQKESNQDKNLASKLLMLYYLLHYEDVRLSNSFQNRNKVKSYSQEFLSELPIKYLLQQAQKVQKSFAGIFPPLVRLLATHFPHLCLVDDWMEMSSFSSGMLYRQVYSNETPEMSKEEVVKGLNCLKEKPSVAGALLGRMLDTPPYILWHHAPTIISYFKHILDPSIPRYIQELYKEVWLRLNSVLPRCLWVMTINALLHIDKPALPSVTLTQENVVLDPLQVLRCDHRVFRCGSVLSIVLRVVQACLAASSSQLARHALDNPLQDKNNTISDTDREELRTALVSAQQSLAVQILLEACIVTREDELIRGQMWALREVRSIICSYLHQLFISTPSLAKLVHFQGYATELLAVTVRGVPSLHICLDFIAELLAQPVVEKQIFAIELVSHLALQYSLPKSLSVAHLALNTLSTLISVLPQSDRRLLVGSALKSIVRLCRAFPPLAEEACLLLLQVGRMSRSESSLNSCAWSEALDDEDMSDGPLLHLPQNILAQEINNAYKEILSTTLLQTDIY